MTPPFFLFLPPMKPGNITPTQLQSTQSAPRDNKRVSESIDQYEFKGRPILTGYQDIFTHLNRLDQGQQLYNHSLSYPVSILLDIGKSPYNQCHFL